MMVGRLAPSPTGVLHAGNLFSAAVAAADVAIQGGQLILRIEDIDTPRCVPGATDLIVRHLRWLGLDWHAGPDTDGGPGPWVQSERIQLYEHAFERLLQSGLLYPCTCSRKDVDDVLSAPHGLPPGMEYPNRCDAPGAPPESERRQQPHAWRFRSRGEVSFCDRVCGEVHERLDDRGDFVVRRRDQLFAYQLAVVVDDMAMGVTSVVRGRDLLDSTARQIALWRALGGTPPTWLHLPLVVRSDGQRLSKRDAAMGADGLQQRGWTGALVLGAFLAILDRRETLDAVSITQFAKEIPIQSLAQPSLILPDAFFESPAAFNAWLNRSSRPRKDSV
jgi:glutamyl-tRNA synthetase